MAAKFNAVKGMNDLLPGITGHWQWLEQELSAWLAQYGYNNIRTPIVEPTQLFTRSIGVATDIVEKEMYSFIDQLNGDALTLRPEGTVGVMRALIEHNLLYNATQKLWYLGPMFRHERPQKGRYRQFHQLGVEAVGFQGPDIDCEIIVMLADLWQRLGLTGIELQINCLGNSSERQAHRQALISYFEQQRELLDEDGVRRLYTNPLRILDSKNPALHELIEQAPRLIDYLGSDSQAHYSGWKQQLTHLGINFRENSRLVRGLDYYNLSVFEWVSADLGAQSTVCGGGRYDPLVAELGGKDNYAIGFAIGLERLMLSLVAQDKLPSLPHPDVYIVNEGAGTAVAAFNLAQDLRQHGFKVVQHFGGGSFKAQFKKADNSGARFACVIGENEVLQQQVVVKSMLQQQQQLVAVTDVVAYLKNFSAV